MRVHSRLDWLLVALGACLLATTVAVLIAAGAGENAPTDAARAQSAAADEQVVIREFKFVPESAEVKVGARLTFVNDDTAAHTATDVATKAFDSGTLDKGDKKTVTLTTTGTFAYICELHPFMKATIKVVA